MLIHISSGNGVDEVCRALWHFYAWLQKHYSFELIRLEHGDCKACYRSITIKSEDKSLLEMEGTLLWRSSSPFRPKHKRKNWYFSLRFYDEAEYHIIDQNKIIYQTMKSPKKGGQHVNTTSSGVRAIYPSLGLDAISYDERSQYRNKQIALERLLEKSRNQLCKHLESEKGQQWKEGKEIARGNPVKIFEGEYFEEVRP